MNRYKLPVEVRTEFSGQSSVIKMFGTMNKQAIPITEFSCYLVDCLLFKRHLLLFIAHWDLVASLLNQRNIFKYLYLFDIDFNNS